MHLTDEKKIIIMCYSSDETFQPQIRHLPVFQLLKIAPMLNPEKYINYCTVDLM